MMTTKKIAIALSTFFVALFAWNTTAFAAENLTEFNSEMQQELKDNTECESGTPVLRISHDVVNGIDSGFYGYWAYNNYGRYIKVYDHGDNTYCAIAVYNGEYDAVENLLSPGEGEVLDGDEDGRFRGGYWATIQGTLKETPDYPTAGYIGTFDAGCDIVAGPSSCTNWNWVDAYFESGSSFSYGWWGWVYRSPAHNWWINASTGSVGDIN